jgi:hypothetical protein
MYAGLMPPLDSRCATVYAISGVPMMGGTNPGNELSQVQYARCALQDYSVALSGLSCPRIGYPLLLVGEVEDWRRAHRGADSEAVDDCVTRRCSHRRSSR